MNVTRGLHNARPGSGCVLTIGNFDGVHRGHQAMVETLRRLAHEHGLAARLLTFEPHPVELLAPERAPPRLTRFREKARLVRTLGVDDLVCARFDATLASMSPERFVDEVLCDRLAVRHLLVGDDFRFGRGGAGTFETLRAASRRRGFGLSRVDTVASDGERVSSTRVRACLAAGELDAAGALLGRPFSICGRVVGGQRLGRTIGFPTANIALRRNRSPLAGVFAVRVEEARAGLLDGVANVGRRPTVGGSEERIEVHLLDFDGDLYGRELEVRFVSRVRPEQRFAGIDALKAQIARDVDSARAALSAGSRGLG